MVRATYGGGGADASRLHLSVLGPTGAPLIKLRVDKAEFSNSSPRTTRTTSTASSMPHTPSLPGALGTQRLRRTGLRLSTHSNLLGAPLSLSLVARGDSLQEHRCAEDELKQPLWVTTLALRAKINAAQEHRPPDEVRRVAACLSMGVRESVNHDTSWTANLCPDTHG